MNDRPNEWVTKKKKTHTHHINFNVNKLNSFLLEQIRYEYLYHLQFSFALTVKMGSIKCEKKAFIRHVLQSTMSIVFIHNSYAMGDSHRKRIPFFRFNPSNAEWTWHFRRWYLQKEFESFFIQHFFPQIHRMYSNAISFFGNKKL